MPDLPDVADIGGAKILVRSTIVKFEERRGSFSAGHNFGAGYDIFATMAALDRLRTVARKPGNQAKRWINNM